MADGEVTKFKWLDFMLGCSTGAFMFLIILFIIDMI